MSGWDRIIVTVLFAKLATVQFSIRHTNESEFVVFMHFVFGSAMPLALPMTASCG